MFNLKAFGVFKRIGVLKQDSFEKLSFTNKFIMMFVVTIFPLGFAMLIKENVISLISLFSSILTPYFMIICPCKFN